VDGTNSLAYVYIFVRTDLSIEQLAVQACHASIEAARHSLIPPGGEHPHLVLCGVRSERELRILRRRLVSHGVGHRAFLEPDLGHSLTAICTQPVRGPTRRIFRRYQCLRSRRRRGRSSTCSGAGRSDSDFVSHPPYEPSETISMNQSTPSYKSRWGFHPCDYATFRKLKLLHRWYFQTLRDYAAWRRWSRKEPQNRVFREYLRDELGRKCGVKSVRPRPEPTYCSLFVADQAPCDRGVVELYQTARTPQESPLAPFSPEVIAKLESLFKEAALHFAIADKREVL
jgi:hypothetical protein